MFLFVILLIGGAIIWLFSTPRLSTPVKFLIFALFMLTSLIGTGIIRNRESDVERLRRQGQKFFSDWSEEEYEDFMDKINDSMREYRGF